GVDVPVARTNVFVWDVRSGLKLSVFRPELLTPSPLVAYIAAIALVLQIYTSANPIYSPSK
ncbi:hypothetical protein, partial [Nostoc sp.]